MRLAAALRPAPSAPRRARLCPRRAGTGGRGVSACAVVPERPGHLCREAEASVGKQRPQQILTHGRLREGPSSILARAPVPLTGRTLRSSVLNLLMPENATSSYQHLQLRLNYHPSDDLFQLHPLFLPFMLREQGCTYVQKISGLHTGHLQRLNHRPFFFNFALKRGHNLFILKTYFQIY